MKHPFLRPNKLSITVISSIIIATPTLLALLAYLGLFASAMVRDPTYTHLVSLLYNWQTQIAGAFAVAAAILGAMAVIYQTNRSKQLEAERRARRAAALRAALPMVLDSIAEYLVGCFNVYSEFTHRRSGTIQRSGIPEFPTLRDTAVAYIVDYIETVEQTEGRPLIVCIRELQKHRARTRDSGRWTAEPTNSAIPNPYAISRIVDIAELYSRCISLFEYARADNKMRAVEITKDDVRKTLFLLVKDDAERHELNEEVDRRAGAASVFGEIWPAI